MNVKTKEESRLDSGSALPSGRLCSDRRCFAPRQSRQRSGAPPAGARPQTACTRSRRSWRTAPARTGWKCHLCAAPTGPPSNALHPEEEFVITAAFLTHTAPSSPPPPPTAASASSSPPPIFTSCFDCAHVSRTRLRTGASALVFLQVVTMTTGAVVPSDVVVTELGAAGLRVVLAFVKV